MGDDAIAGVLWKEMIDGWTSECGWGSAGVPNKGKGGVDLKEWNEEVGLR